MAGLSRRTLLCFGASAVLLVLAPIGGAATTCPLSQPACSAPAAFTGSVRASAGRCESPAPGCVTLRGPRGRRGLTGIKGVAGAAGEIGAAGMVGAAGSTGNAGAQGLQGPAGPSGGPQGPPGAAGATGNIGAIGAIGATGATGINGLAQYAYVYNVSPETVVSGAQVSFDSNGEMTAGITHVPATLTEIKLANPGTYAISFSVSAVQTSQMAVDVNGAAVAGATYASGAGTEANAGEVIDTVPANSIVTIVNETATSVQLQGAVSAYTNAWVEIEQIG